MKKPKLFWFRIVWVILAVMFIYIVARPFIESRDVPPETEAVEASIEAQD